MLGLTISFVSGRAVAQTSPASVSQTAPKSAGDSVYRHVPTPDTLRGLYVSHWAAIGRKLNSLIGIAKRTEINALVIDVKDDRGFVLYRSRVPLAHDPACWSRRTFLRR